MNKPISQAVIESGIVEKEMIQQLCQWGYLPEEATTVQPVDDNIVVQNIQEAIESGDVVTIKESDLDAIKGYLKNKKSGKLHLPNPDEEGKTVPISVKYSLTKFGEYVIPWNSHTISDLMVEEGAYLKPVGEPRVHFVDVRELYYGDHKAFMVCVPREGK